MLDIKRIAKTILACCVLHNVCIDQCDIEESFEAGNLEYAGFISATTIRRRDDVEISLQNPTPLPNNVVPAHPSAPTLQPTRMTTAALRDLKKLAIAHRNTLLESLRQVEQANVLTTSDQEEDEADFSHSDEDA